MSKIIIIIIAKKGKPQKKNWISFDNSTNQYYKDQLILWNRIANDTKRAQDTVQLSEKGNSQGIMQEIKIWPCNQMVYSQAKIHLREWDV